MRWKKHGPAKVPQWHRNNHRNPKSPLRNLRMKSLPGSTAQVQHGCMHSVNSMKPYRTKSIRYFQGIKVRQRHRRNRRKVTVKRISNLRMKSLPVNTAQGLNADGRSAVA